MSKFKYTPGPWVADKTSRAVGPVSKEDEQSNGMVLLVAWVEFDPEVEIQAANQQLIAAAPELLEALQDMLSGWEYIRAQHGDLYGVGWDRAERKAQAAIKKAMGDQHD